MDIVTKEILEEDINMGNNTSEQERKELNKRLLKRTFIGEIRNRKKGKKVKVVLDFICYFIAFSVADLIDARLQIDFWLLEIVIYIVIAMIMLFVSEIIVEKIKK